MRRFALVICIGLALVACTTSQAVTFNSARVPWSFPLPSAWHTSTIRSEPNPDRMAGLLRTYIANVRYAFAFDSATPGPNSGAGASEALGPSAVVVQIDLLWYPPDGPIAWGEGGLTVGRASAWHEDAQNPGWVFRERKTCLGRTCVHIVEWHGPKALDEAVKAGADIAEALRLKPGWIDPTA